ncbi:MAG TPA: ABC transporter ATP-binding protein, partial [Croceibacterium sp.]
DDGTAREYAGSIEDYIDFVLGRNQPKTQDKAGRKDKPPARAREDAKRVKQQVQDAERAVARVQARIAEIDAAMLDPRPGALEDLARERAVLAKELELAEEAWLEASQQLEQAA